MFSPEKIKNANNIKYFMSIVFILSLAIWFNYSSLNNIILKIFKWHINQPESKEGGLEIFILFLIISGFSIIVRNYKIRTTIIILLILLYLKLHQVLLPTITAIVYLEILLSFGRLILSLNKNYNICNIGFRHHFDSLLVGISTWCLIGLFLSKLGFGRFDDLRLLTLGIGICCVINFKGTLLSIDLFKKFHQGDKLEKVGFSFLLILILIQLAKSNSAIDYDSVWYGLRPEQVLIGESSFFDNLGLTMFVHFYPKLFEFLLIPVSNLGDYSFILNVTTMFLLFLFLVIYSFFSEVGLGKKETILLTCLIGCIPAISNMGSSAKTDIIFSLLLVLTAYYLWKWINIREQGLMIFALIGTLLCLQTKVTSFLYIPLLYLGLFLTIIIHKRFLFKEVFKLVEIENIHKNLFYLKILFVTITVFLGFSYRTFKLTGYPFYPFLGGLWSYLGFKVQYPFLENSKDILITHDMGIKDIIILWYNVWFNPGNYSLQVAVWPGNIMFFLFLIFLSMVIFNGKRMLKHTVILVFVLPIFISRIYLLSVTPNGGDGNYYIPTIILVSIGLLSVIIPLLKPKLKMIFLISIFLFIPIQTSIMFVSHFSWQWGTSKFSSNLFKSDFETYDSKKKKFAVDGLSEIESYLEKKQGSFNCIGFGVEQTLNQLSCRFENIPNIGSRYGNSDLTNDPKHFLEYMKWAKVRYIIQPVNKQKFINPIEAQKIIDLIETNPNVLRINANNYYLLDLEKIDLKSIDF